MLYPEDGSRDEDIGRFCKLVGGAHMHARKKKIIGNGEKIGGAARSRTGYFKDPLFKLI